MVARVVPWDQILAELQSRDLSVRHNGSSRFPGVIIDRYEYWSREGLFVLSSDGPFLVTMEETEDRVTAQEVANRIHFDYLRRLA